MHTSIPTNGKPTNGAAAHGPAAAQQPASANSASGASSPRAVPPTSRSPAPQQSAVPPVTPHSKVSAAGDITGKRPPAATAPTANKPKSAAEVKGESPAVSTAGPKSQPRPYFYPAGTDLESLSNETQSAIREIVVPCYEQLVMAERNPMAKALGGVFSADTAMGILAQQESVAAVMSGTAEPEELELLMARHDKSVKRIERMANLLLRFKTYQAKQGPLGSQP